MLRRPSLDQILHCEKYRNVGSRNFDGGGFGPPGGGYSGGSGAIPLFPAVDQQLNRLMPGGGLPTEIFLCDEASGNLSGEVTSEVLTATGTPSYENATAWSGEVAVGFTDAGDDYFGSSDSSFMDVTTNSVAILLVFKIVAELGGLRRLMSKFISDAGYSVRITSGGVIQIIFGNDASAQIVATTTGNHADGNYHIALAVINRTSGNAAIHTTLDSKSAAITPAGSYTTGAVWRLSSPGTNSPGGHIAYAAGWLSGAAEGLDNDDLLSFKAHLGL
jgi:hypothetical protein